MDVVVSSISDNGGLSCVNASAVIVPKYGREIADALGQRLGPLKPLPVDDPNAVLSGFANPKMGEWINSTLEADLLESGAFDATAPYGDGTRLLEAEEEPICDRQSYIAIPWITHWQIENFSVLTQVSSKCLKEMLRAIGPTLVVTAITKDEIFKRQLLGASSVERLNLGPISTMKISRDQPHEGNMFEFLYKRRSIGMAA